MPERFIASAISPHQWLRGEECVETSTAAEKIYSPLAGFVIVGQALPLAMFPAAGRRERLPYNSQDG